MDRQLSNQVDNLLRTIQPVTFGGTGAQTDITATASLGLATENHLGATLGIVPLDAGTKVPQEYLTDLSTTNGDTIQLLVQNVYAGQYIDAFAFITNYDCQRTYDISTSLDGEGGAEAYFLTRDIIEQENNLSPGTYEYNMAGLISLQAPPDPSELEIYINSAILHVTVLEPYIDAPTIIVPLGNNPDDVIWLIDQLELIRQNVGGEGDNPLGIAITAPTFTHGYYQYPLTVEVVFSSTSDFNNIFFSFSANDGTSYSVEHAININEQNLRTAWNSHPGDFYVRVRYIGPDMYGHWSNIIHITQGSLG